MLLPPAKYQILVLQSLGKCARSYREAETMLCSMGLLVQFDRRGKTPKVFLLECPRQGCVYPEPVSSVIASPETISAVERWLR